MRILGLIVIVVVTVLEIDASAQVDTAWVRHWSSSQYQDDVPFCMAVDGCGSTIVGCKTDTINIHAEREEFTTVLSYDPHGNLSWTYRFDVPGSGSDYPRAIGTDAFGNVLVGGVTDGPGPGLDFNFFLLKLSSSGNFLWDRRFNGPVNGSDVLTALAVDDIGNIYVTGYSEFRNSANGDWDFSTIKYSPDGVTLWQKRYAGPTGDDDMPWAIAVDAAGSVYVTGGSPGLGFSSPDFVTVKYDLDGNFIWEARNAQTNYCCDRSFMTLLPGEGLYVTAPVRPSGDHNIVSWKIDFDGQIEWTQTYDNPLHLDDIPNAQVLDEEGNLYVTGWSHGGNSWNDVASIRISHNGALDWSRRFNGVTNLYDWGTCIAVDANGNVLVGGLMDGQAVILSESSAGDSLWSIKNSTQFPIGYEPNGLIAAGDGAVHYSASAAGSGLDVLTAKLQTSWAVQVDLLPGSCPNVINTGGIDLDYHSFRPGSAAAGNRKTVPVAILGTKAFDVSRVDPATILIAGLAPISSRLLDVSRPVETRETPCECTTLGADRYLDLVLYFDQVQLLAALGPTTDGASINLALTGKTKTGVPLSGSDCVTVKEGPIRNSPLASAGEKTETGFSAYPNPFNAATVISFSLSAESDVRLDVYDVLGRHVATLAEGLMPAGEHRVSWDAAGVASGVYFARLATSEGMMTRKMVLVR